MAVCAALFSAQPTDGNQEHAVDVRLDTTQAKSSLEILALRSRGETVLASHWSRVFESEGYKRVVERERGMDAQLGIDRGFSEESFRAWAESDAALEHLDGRERTLQEWSTLDVAEAGSRAMQYLPRSAKLSATVYPIVREQSNSFVWDLPDDPAIFMWVGPDMSAEELAMTLIHELHHVGLAGACEDSTSSLPQEVKRARGWLSGFGEGLAVLAAAGGPELPTHPANQTKLRKAWVLRMDSLETDMRRTETFLLDVAEGRISDEEARGRGMTFINTEEVPQGAFYSLGWFMGATVERSLGRDAVVRATCDHGRLLLDYQRVAKLANESGGQPMLPLWNERTLTVLELR